MARPLSQEAREKMLDSAAAVALEVGIRAFTITAVAAHSGVAKTTIYRHFPSKNDLIIQALDRATPNPRVPDTGELRGDLVDFLGEVLPIFASSELRALFLEVIAVSNLDPELAALQHNLMEGRGSALASIVERAQRRGEIPDDLDRDTAVEIIEGPLIVRGLLNPARLDDLDLDGLVDIIVARLQI